MNVMRSAWRIQARIDAMGRTAWRKAVDPRSGKTRHVVAPGKCRFFRILPM